MVDDIEEDELKLPHDVGVPLTLNAPSPLEPPQIRVPAVCEFVFGDLTKFTPEENLYLTDL